MRSASLATNRAAVCTFVWFALLCGCSSGPKPEPTAAQAAAAEARRCKFTRNIQPSGPQPASNPPRCANSVDAGKLPATVIPPILVGH